MTAGLFEQMVEHIAEAWFEEPCEPDEEGCSPVNHLWDIAYEEDREHARRAVRFILRAVGIDG